MFKTLMSPYYPTSNSNSKTNNINAAKTAEIMSKYRPIAPKPDTTNESTYYSQSQSSYLKTKLWPQLQARPTRTRKRNNRVERPNLKRSKILYGSVPNMVPEEKDLLQQLELEEQKHQSIRAVITPQPVRPVGSTIVFGSVAVAEEKGKTVIKRIEEVEEEVESEELPAIISDSNNKVRMANSAYKKMIGQPLCPWLELGGDSCCKRICGEVMLLQYFCDDDDSWYSNENGNEFSCWVRIEWEGQDRGDKTCVNAFADVVRSSICKSPKDDVFTWRFHTATTTSL